MYRHYGAAAERDFFKLHEPENTRHGFEICIRERSNGKALTQKMVKFCDRFLQRKNDSTGGLTAQEIVAMIRFNLRAIRECYEAALKDVPKLQGKLNVRFIINGKGLIKSVIPSTVSTDLKNAKMIGCVEREISAWIFPRPRGGKDVTVNYPFVFNPL